jgi:hypothetical protein
MSAEIRLAYYAWAWRLLDRIRIAEMLVRKATLHESLLREEQLSSLQYLLDAIEEVREHFPEFAQFLSEDEEQ